MAEAAPAGLDAFLGEAGLGDMAGLAKGATSPGQGSSDPSSELPEMPGPAKGALNALTDVGEIPDLNTFNPSGAGSGITSSYGDELETPDSISRRIEDPENIDPHQRPDGSNDHWDLDMKDVNEIGSTNDPRGEDNSKNKKEHLRKLFASRTPEQEDAIAKFKDALPLFLEYFNSEESGSEDPIIKSVMESLEGSFPGFQDLAVPDEKNKIVLVLGQGDKKTSADLANGTAPVSINSRCPICGGTKDPSTEKCPQCNPPRGAGESPAWPYGSAESLTQKDISVPQPRAASSTQGPHTDTQQQAFSEFCIENGLEHLIPLALQDPSNAEVVKVWSDIVNQDPMLDSDPADVPAPQPEQMAPNQGLPVPPMQAPTPGELGGPQGGGTAPPGQMAMNASAQAEMFEVAYKYGADSIAGTCPKCDSHTTRMVSQDGTARCHTCGHEWSDTFIPSDGHSTDSAATASYHAALDKITADLSRDQINEYSDRVNEILKGSEAPQAASPVEPQNLDSFGQPENTEPQIDDSTHTWKDQEGQPLQEGKEYEIYSSGYDIPDVGRVIGVKPDSISYEIESDGGLRTRIDIDRQEADLNGYSFSPVQNDPAVNPPGIEENDDSRPLPAPGEQTDLSSPHRAVGSVKEADKFDDLEELETNPALKQAVAQWAKEWLLQLSGNSFDEFDSQDQYVAQVDALNEDQLIETLQRLHAGGAETAIADCKRDLAPRSQPHPQERLQAQPQTGDPDLAVGQKADMAAFASTEYVEDTDHFVDEARIWLAGIDGPSKFKKCSNFSLVEWVRHAHQVIDDEAVKNAVKQNFEGGWDGFVAYAKANQPEEEKISKRAMDMMALGSGQGRTAGKSYTPMEQRELIDEYGEARNADKLSLEGTHYAEASDDEFLFGC